MSSADDSLATPSTLETSEKTSEEGHTAATSQGHGSPMEMEEVDGSSDPAANEAQSLKLKEDGNVQLLEGHYLEAIGLYSDALEYSPTNVVVLSNRAQAYIKVENYGLAMADATVAITVDPNYAKAYYRRGSAQYALGHLKDARKDFRKVCQLQPKSKDARAKLQACEKAIREEAFRKAIESEMSSPLSESYDPNALVLNASSYDGPHPLISDGPTEDMDLEASLFDPGKLPREFVEVSRKSIW
jgi:tetratricopeptide (TPR) repeat protein